MDENVTPDEPAADERPTNRYTGLAVNGNEVVIYDRENHERWIQSDSGVALTQMQ